MKMAVSSPNRYKTLWEKEKLLVTSNFSFSHGVFKRLVLQTHKNQGLFGKGLKIHNYAITCMAEGIRDTFNPFYQDMVQNICKLSNHSSWIGKNIVQNGPIACYRKFLNLPNVSNKCKLWLKWYNFSVKG